MPSLAVRGGVFRCDPMLVGWTTRPEGAEEVSVRVRSLLSVLGGLWVVLHAAAERAHEAPEDVRRAVETFIS